MKQVWRSWKCKLKGPETHFAYPSLSANLFVFLSTPGWSLLGLHLSPSLCFLCDGNGQAGGMLTNPTWMGGAVRGGNSTFRPSEPTCVCDSRSHLEILWGSSAKGEMIVLNERYHLCRDYYPFILPGKQIWHVWCFCYSPSTQKIFLLWFFVQASYLAFCKTLAGPQCYTLQWKNRKKQMDVRVISMFMVDWNLKKKKKNQKNGQPFTIPKGCASLTSESQFSVPNHSWVMVWTISAQYPLHASVSMLSMLAWSERSNQTTRSVNNWKWSNCSWDVNILFPFLTLLKFYFILMSLFSFD